MTLAIIAVWLLIGALFITAIFIIKRQPREQPRGNYTAPILLIIIGVALVYGQLDARERRLNETLATQQRDAKLLAQGYLPPALSRLTVDLNECPPRTDGMTDQVLMTIATQADRGGPIVTGCSRIAHRPHIARSAR